MTHSISAIQSNKTHKNIQAEALSFAQAKLIFSVTDFDSNANLSQFQEIQNPDTLVIIQPSLYMASVHLSDQTRQASLEKVMLTAQWYSLKDIYEELEQNLLEMKSGAWLFDQVFCAHVGLPFITPAQQTGIFLSHPAKPNRRQEPRYFQHWMKSFAYPCLTAAQENNWQFEGAADAVWHPGRYLLWGGLTSGMPADMFCYIQRTLEVPFIALRITDPAFSHLIECFTLLRSDTALYYPEAFAPQSRELLEHLIPNLIPVRREEALNAGCQSFCPDGRHVLIQAGSEALIREIKRQNLIPLIVDTSHYMKHGGSIAAMKLGMWLGGQAV